MSTSNRNFFLLMIPAGLFGGFVCGYIILSFGMLIGRSGTTGSEYPGYWTPAVWFDALIYGGLIGAIMLPLAYVTVLQKAEPTKSWVLIVLGTILGGAVGALISPPLAVVVGVISFFIICHLIASGIRRSESASEDD